MSLSRILLLFYSQLFSLLVFILFLPSDIPLHTLAMKPLNSICVGVMACAVVSTKAFSIPQASSKASCTTTSIALANNDNDGGNKPKNVFQDLMGMFKNLDDVVDDFVYKRMGAGEQWYGKRKYDPSGNFEGNYEGAGQTDITRIEIARVQKEEMEKRKQRRLEEEAEARKNA